MINMRVGSLLRNKFKVDPIYKVIQTSFDVEFYLSSHSDVRLSGMDPIRHYIEHGHDEGRDPTPDFSTRGYLARYPDVAAAGMNAFFHFLRHGRHENRATGPVLSISGRLPPEVILEQGNPSATMQGGNAISLFDYVPSLDQAKVSRLLGIDVTTLVPRVRRVGMTHILQDAGEGLGEAPVDFEHSMPDGEQLANEMLAAAKGKTLSLDVWDTILRRNCAPDAIKLRHARKQWLTLVDREGLLGNLHPVDLLHLRRMAEAEAADEHFEYKIEDVAKCLSKTFTDGDEDFAEKFLSSEMQIERNSISVDEVVGDIISRHDGRKIILSDFYMPGHNIEKLLSHVGIYNIDSVYSSSDHMATKRAGHLYDLALKNEALSPDQVLHIGDRFGADVTAAQKRGVNAFHYYSPSHQPRLEKLDRDFWSHMDGDDTVYARGLAMELGHNPGSGPSVELLSVAATCFVLHVMEEALRRRVDKIFFCTREGDFFRRIYDVMVSRDVFDLGAYPEAVILEVSRRSTFAASMDDFSVDELMRLWSQYSKQSIAALATTLNVDIAEWAPVAKKVGLDVDELVDMPWRDPRVLAFVRHPRVSRAARVAIGGQRTALLEYLRAVGFEPDADTHRVIVDIGWRGTIQDNLARVVSGSIHGCYFGLESFLNRQAANVSKTGYVFDANKRYPLHVAEVAGLEFLFNAPGGSTTGYRNGSALREVVAEEEAIVRGPVAVLQERMLDASAKIADYVKTHGLVSFDLVSFAREVVANFAAKPAVEVAEAFFRLSHNESFGVGIVDSMRFDVQKLASMAKLQGAALHGEMTRQFKNLRWPAAARQLRAYRELEDKLSPSQKLHIPPGPAIVKPGSLGQPRVAVLSPAPIRGSGGHRTIFNLASALARHGYDVHLMHEHSADHATEEWIGSVLGNVSLTQHSAWLNYLNPTASVATIWYSAGYAGEFWADTTTPFYFVQDYEAMFNPMGDTFLRASQSYSWGARHLCVGRWLAHNLRRQFGVGVAAGGLGVDHEVYRPLPDAERKENQIALLFQPEKFRRAPELCARALSIVKARMPQTRIVLYGSDTRPHLNFEYEHRGLIADVREINELYNESAVGLCISSTNPSRIPFEMMASGCVPVDIYRYNNLFDYDAGTGVLAYESPESIAEALISLLEDPAYCAKRAQKGMQSVRDRSLAWEMDVAVNAVDMGLNNFDFDTLDLCQLTYTDEPVVAKSCDTRAVRHFLKHQKNEGGAV